MLLPSATTSSSLFFLSSFLFNANARFIPSTADAPANPSAALPTDTSPAPLSGPSSAPLSNTYDISDSSFANETVGFSAIPPHDLDVYYLPQRPLDLFSDPQPAKRSVGARSSDGAVKQGAGEPLINKVGKDKVMLKPLVHRQTNLHDYTNLQPCKQVNYFYGDPSAEDQSMLAAYSLYTFVYPLVPLEHTAYIAGLTCSAAGSTIKITFATKKAFQVAASWPRSEFILAGVGTDDCVPHPEAGDRFWGLVSHISYDAARLTVVCTVEQRALRDVMDNVEVKWGNERKEAANPSGGAWQPSAPLVRKGTASSSSASSQPSLPLTTQDQRINFDLLLDNQLGYIDPNTPGFLNLVMPVAGNSKRDLEERGELVKRRFGFFRHLISSVRNAFNSARAAAQRAIAAAIAAVVAALNHVYNESFSRTIAFNANANQVRSLTKQTTAFGTGVVLYSRPGNINGTSIDLLCNNCGMSATFALTGAFSFSIAHGFGTATFGVSGPVDVEIEVALIVDATFTEQYNVTLLNAPITPFEIGSVASIGPSVSLTLGVGLVLDAQGGILAGVDLHWNDFAFNLDVINPGRTTGSGLAPNSIRPVFGIEGQVSVTGEIYLIAALALELQALGGTFQVSAGINEKPEIVVDIVAGGTAGTPARSCNGLAIDLTFENEVYLDLIKAGNKANERDYPIESLTRTLTDYCFSTTATTTTTTTTSPTTTTTTSPTTTTTTTTTTSTTTSTTTTTTTTSTTTSTTPTVGPTCAGVPNNSISLATGSVANVVVAYYVTCSKNLNDQFYKTTPDTTFTDCLNACATDFETVASCEGVAFIEPGSTSIPAGFSEGCNLINGYTAGSGTSANLVDTAGYSSAFRKDPGFADGNEVLSSVVGGGNPQTAANLDACISVCALYNYQNGQSCQGVQFIEASGLCTLYSSVNGLGTTAVTGTDSAIIYQPG